MLVKAQEQIKIDQLEGSFKLKNKIKFQ